MQAGVQGKGDGPEQEKNEQKRDGLGKGSGDEQEGKDRKRPREEEGGEATKNKKLRPQLASLAEDANIEGGSEQKL